MALRKQAAQQKQAELERKLSAQALQRNLPLPASVNRDILRSGTTQDELVVSFGSGGKGCLQAGEGQPLSTHHAVVSFLGGR